MSAAPQKAKAGAEQIPVIVSAIVPLNELVTRFEFRRVDGGLFPTFSGGAHTVVEMKDGDRTRRNPYSLMSDPNDTSHYAVSVRREDEGRGGSLFMHQQVNVGDEMKISYPVNLFSLDLRARKHLFFAGGIGITPFMAMIHQLERMNGNWELHYAVRSRELGTYSSELEEKYGKKVHVYQDDLGQAIDLPALLSRQPLGTNSYACGPKGMIQWIRSTAETFGWPESQVRSEEFTAPKPGKVFEVRLCKSNRTITVGENESLLEALEREGVDQPFLCRGGACGVCETNVISYDGEFDHRDHWLEDDQKTNKIMPCVSRFVGTSLELDR